MPMSNPSMLPLHKSCKDAAKQLDSHLGLSGSHLGLYFDKYFSYSRSPNNNIEAAPENKKEFLKKFNKANIPPSLENANINQVRLIQKLNGTFKAFKTTSSFVTGMGQDHPLENGFAFHPTYGTPYLPGSSVKGMLRHFFTHHYQWGNEDKATFLNQVFGSDNPKQPAIGNYLFFDALPTETVTMHTEIMTPHYGDWYAKGGDKTENTKNDTSSQAIGTNQSLSNSLLSKTPPSSLPSPRAMAQPSSLTTSPFSLKDSTASSCTLALVPKLPPASVIWLLMKNKLKNQKKMR